MNTPSNESLANNEPFMTRGEKIGVAAAAVAIAGLYGLTKIAPDALHTFAHNALEFLGFHPLFENGPVISPQDGGPVMGG